MLTPFLYGLHAAAGLALMVPAQRWTRPWLRLPLPTTTARLPRRATTARPRSVLELEPMLLHAPFAGTAPPWLQAPHARMREQIESRVLVNTTYAMSWKEKEVDPTTMTARHLASCQALADTQNGNPGVLRRQCPLTPRIISNVSIPSDGPGFGWAYALVRTENALRMKFVFSFVKLRNRKPQQLQPCSPENYKIKQ